MSNDPPPQSPHVARLSEQERETLRLLGEGHTAKSIAEHTGRSFSSVNESLRRARQKAGVGSSRELARQLRDDKIVDEQISLPSPAYRAPKGRAHLVKGAIAMTISAVIIATAALWTPAQTGPQSTNDPLLTQLMPPAGQEPRALAELVRSESRDASWADQAEAALRRRYSALLRDKRIDLIGIRCAATACEFAGKLQGGDTVRVNAIMQVLQGAELNQKVSQPALSHVAITFGPDNVFATYWIREKN